ncbi:MAG TPA: hypothetical protein VGS61_02030 [Acidimicrobiales bacterium]|nr:hypothetical protein [Acidimicrobiales bacterium]
MDWRERRRDVVLTTFSLAAVLETGWIVYLGWSLPRHYVANHWDIAWVGIDSFQVLTLLLSAWAAWRRRSVLVLFSCACGTLLVVDAWFDVLTARYSDLDTSLWFLALEIPLALVMFWVAWRIHRRLTAPGPDGRSRATLESDWRETVSRSRPPGRAGTS